MKGFFYPILNPHGFRGSWTKDQAYLDDFDAAIVKWGKSHIYSLRFAKISQTMLQQKPKSREEQKYEYAQYLVRDMNRHGYRRRKVNDELESSGLMDDLVSHGFEKHDNVSTKNHDEYKNEAIVALNDYIDRDDAEHGIKRQTSANVPTQGEDVEFYRAWLEGLGYVTSSFFAAAFANTASKFTSDPKKITGAAGVGAAFEGAVLSMAGALGGGGSYRPEVVGPRDRPAAVAPWRYAGKQPIKPAADIPVAKPTPPPTLVSPRPAPKATEPTGPARPEHIGETGGGGVPPPAVPLVLRAGAPTPPATSAITGESARNLAIGPAGTSYFGILDLRTGDIHLFPGSGPPGAYTIGGAARTDPIVHGAPTTGHQQLVTLAGVPGESTVGFSLTKTADRYTALWRSGLNERFNGGRGDRELPDALRAVVEPALRDALAPRPSPP